MMSKRDGGARQPLAPGFAMAAAKLALTLTIGMTAVPGAAAAATSASPFLYMVTTVGDFLESTRAQWEPTLSNLPPALASWTWAQPLVTKEILESKWNTKENLVARANLPWDVKWDNVPTLGKDPRSDFTVDGLRGDVSQPAWVRLAVEWLYPVPGAADFLGSTYAFFCRSHELEAWVVVAVYLTFVFMFRNGTKLKEGERPPKPHAVLKWSTALWNFGLFLFSLMGMMRTIPHLVLTLQTEGFVYSLCRNMHSQYGNGVVGYWVCLFIFSKYAELGDTVLLVLRGKPVQFLHWYHHATVLLYCWEGYACENSTGMYFVSINYTCHTIMYLFYTIAAVGKPPSWAFCVTFIQLSQMVIGMGLVLTHLSLLRIPNLHCDGNAPNLLFAFLIYATYFYLFLKFMLKRYCGCGRRAPAAGKAAVKNKKQ